MKVTCDRENLSIALSAVLPAVPRRHPEPILQNVKLTTTEFSASLTATDLALGIRVSVERTASVDRGSILLPAQRLNRILHTVPDATLDIESDGDRLVIRTEHAGFELPTEDASLFPDVPDLTMDSGSWSVRSPDLKQAIRRTIFATDPNSTRYALQGVLFEFGPETLTLVATDGRRLAWTKINPEWSDDVEFPSPSVIPALALKLIDRNLDADESVRISPHTANAVLVQTNSATVHACLVAGRFPHWEDVIPDSRNARITIPEVASLRRAVDQVAITTEEGSWGSDFSFEPGLLRLSSQSADVGRSKIELPLDYDGPTITTRIDHRYLSDALKSLDPAEPVTVDLIDAKSPVVLTAGAAYRYVVMPLH